ncbi:MAG: hypothetical protein ACTSYB_19315 [Candidatus Helarchaeota archaeon]
MKRAKVIRLNLSNDWLYFDSRKFRPVGNKRNFRPGDLLYRDSEFYVVDRRTKLKKISWPQAGKLIYNKLDAREFEKFRYRQGPSKLSKQKILFKFQINEEEEVQTSLKVNTFPDIIIFERTHPDLNDLQQETPRKAITGAEKLAKSIFYTVIRKHKCFKIRGVNLIIKSKNGKMYRINLNSGQVFSLKNYPICVASYGSWSLPFFDQVLAKALTIAYAPERIYTLS